MRRRYSTAMIGAGLVIVLHAPLAVFAQGCDAEAATANLDFVLKDMDGQDVALSDYRGQVILLDFWATWCAPCRIEIPNFVELYDQYGPEGFVVVGISVDEPGTDLKPFAAELKMDYPVLVGSAREDLLNAYGPPVGYPTAFIIGRDGAICKTHTGFASKDQFEQGILLVL
jgi:cytochrome c biogenesis protein CcmG/thiol:disulfide interchange protein DsbE